MKKLIALFLTAVLVISLAGCSGAAVPNVQTHTIQDQDGHEVTVPREINRIVVADILPLPSVLAVFFDSAEKIVGMSGTSMNAAENSLLGQLYPEILEAETGFINGTTVNAEELMKLQPDVVFYNASRKELGENLRKAGFPAVAISVNKWDYDCIETLNNWIDLLNKMFPDNDKADLVKNYSGKVYDLVQERVAGIPEDQRQQLFFLYKYTAANLETSGGRFFGQWWAEAIGAKNVAAELTTDNSVAVNMEQIYAWNPSLIFITNFTTATAGDLYSGTVGNDNWSAVDAVASKQVYKMPLGMYRSFTPGVDTPVTLLWLAKTAYPDAFADIDIIHETKTYYKEVFGIGLTDQQAASIFAPAADAGAGF